MKEELLCKEDILYNVNKIIIDSDKECEYIEFSHALNRNLLIKYPRYYLGLQLYEQNESPNDHAIFYVVASYRNIPGLYEVAPYISEYINEQYEKRWGPCVKRISIFSYTTSTKIY